MSELDPFSQPEIDAAPDDATVVLSGPAALDSTYVMQSESTAFLAEGDETYTIAAQARPRYDMVLMVGEGAMGQVFLARDVDLLRKVAYKKLHDKVAVDRGVLSRFLKEVQITAQLEHPNVVPVYTLEKTADQSLA